MTITQTWRRLDSWLAEHAPATYAVLAPPATDDELDAARQVVELPPDLIESLRCHNGLTAWANLLPEAPPSSAAQITDNWQLRMDIAADVDGFTVHPWNTEPYWHLAWIPWADADGDLQVIDGSGRLGMASHDGVGDFSTGWPDLASYLSAVVDALHTGTGVNGWYPYLTTHRELWWDRGPDQQFVNDEPLIRVPVVS
ncbi:hypothetical protein ACFTSF_13840 [Kribbella sp. NPDC056951]|uniref:hypothetical protein n=1 Tax=Kribbella sp. NPDC056951 TaxID=3345978 RepID=UPI00363E70A6